MIRRPPRSTLCPCTTLVLSGQEPGLPVLRLLDREPAGAHDDEAGEVLVLGPQPVRDPRPDARPDLPRLAAVRSEEHTSELQSRQYLVCRLLLAKKPQRNTSY